MVFTVYQHPTMRASTAVGVSPEIKTALQKTSVEVRLTVKETIYMGVKAIALLSDEQKQALADEVHKLQMTGDI
jgi:hypothetical protein